MRLGTLAATVLFLISLGLGLAVQAQYRDQGGNKYRDHRGEIGGDHRGGGHRRGRGSGIGGAANGIAIGAGIISNEAAKAANNKKTKRTTKAQRKQPKKQARTPTPVAVPDFISGEILLVFAPATSDAEVNQFILEYGLRPISDTRIGLLNLHIVRATRPGSITPERALQIASDPRVVAQPNYLYVPATDQTPQYALTKLGVPKAHETVQGAGILVAVIDSGVDSKHPALAGAVLEEFAVVGENFKSTSSLGTAVASIIAAREGMTSVAPQSQILSIKAFARDKKLGRTLANTFDIVKGIDYAVGKGARILNLSFAGPRDRLLGNAISAAGAQGVVIVAAAGNKGPKAPPAYPGAYAEVIAATAIDAKDQLYSQANRGDYIAIAAPGADVLAAAGRKGYRLNSGTSMAAAYISGSIALMMQNSPDLDSNTAIARLAASAKDLGDEGEDAKYGHGLIDVAKAVNGN